MSLENYGVAEMTTREMETINGGRLRGLKKLYDLTKKYGGKLLAAAGVYDAIDEFVAGWNEVECQN